MRKAHTNPHKVYISANDVQHFNAQWPGSPIEVRPHFVEFDKKSNLIDHDFTEDEDGTACLALIQDAEQFSA